MLELFHESLKFPNLPATVLLLIVLVYWIINLIGMADIEIFGHGDIDLDTHDSDSFIGKTFDFGDLPITIVFSIFALFFWMGTILCNHYLGNNSMIFALIIYIPCLIVGFIITKFIAMPLSRAYSWLNQNSEQAVAQDYTGSVGIVTIEASEDSKGQIEVKRGSDAIRVTIVTTDGNILKKGEQALLIQYFPDRSVYTAAPYQHAE